MKDAYLYLYLNVLFFVFFFRCNFNERRHAMHRHLKGAKNGRWSFWPPMKHARTMLHAAVVSTNPIKVCAFSGMIATEPLGTNLNVTECIANSSAAWVATPAVV